MQAYPAMEYRFTPERITVTTDDVVCFAWSGEKKSILVCEQIVRHANEVKGSTRSRIKPRVSLIITKAFLGTPHS